jgi:hypothetical protein
MLVVVVIVVVGWNGGTIDQDDKCEKPPNVATNQKVDRNPNHDVRIPQVRICTLSLTSISNPNPGPACNPY